MKAIYPEHNWPSIRQTTQYKPYGFWKDIKNQKIFLDNLANKLNITKPEDWYSVKVETVLREGGYFVLSYYQGSLTRGKA
jgi:hypothetical protein